MEFNDHQPIYIQIIDYVKFKIIRGEVGPGEKIPSVREIAMELKVNPNTVQRAYQELDRENITYAKRGLGSFVVDDPERIDVLRKEKAAEIIDIFVTDMKKLGIDKDTAGEILERSWNNDTGSE